MTTTATTVAELNAVYTDAVNRAVAEDRMDLVAALAREFDVCLNALPVAC
jgi:hypothetical protein